MPISAAYAAAEATAGAATDAAKGAAAEAAAAMPVDAPSASEAFMWNMGLILVLVVMFYVLMIMPQQRRFKEHKEMLDSLKKGDKVLTSGGLLGKVDKLVDKDEVIVDLGNGIKVTALRSTIQTRIEDPKAAKSKDKDSKDKDKNKAADKDPEDKDEKSEKQSS